MLRIAICDDDRKELSQLQGLLAHYSPAVTASVRLSEFSSPKELLNFVMENGAFDIYILDVLMPEMNGIELGLELRKTDKTGLIIYLTSSPDFALESYRPRAFYYLLKPVNSKQFFQVLDEAIRTQAKLQDSGIQVKTRDGIVRLSFDNILYAELRDRHVRYYLTDGAVVDGMTIPGSFKDAVTPLLQEQEFRLCGSSFVVNLHHIKMVDKSGARFSDERYLTLPKSACAALRSSWSDYWLEEGHSLC